jgi:predicted transglutaminase-like cysteine proteinase
MKVPSILQGESLNRLPRRIAMGAVAAVAGLKRFSIPNAAADESGRRAMGMAKKIALPLAAMLSVVLCTDSGPANAVFLGLPKTLEPQLDRIVFDVPTLPPMAHSVFCIRYPDDCQVEKIALPSGKMELTPRQWKDLVEVNANVNRSIAPEQGRAGEKWRVSPKTGECSDYAVTKRHELLARGWPSHALLLAEVVTQWGEHHLVLVIDAREGDYVLDSLNATIRSWSMTQYEWTRIESPRNPKWWSTVRSTGV